MRLGKEGCPVGEQMTACARMITDLNINHYRDLLKTETEPSKRRAIANLLAEEEAKLARLFVIQEPTAC
jgi:hypothetical protein